MTTPVRSGPESRLLEGRILWILGVGMVCIAIPLLMAATAHGPHDDAYFISAVLLIVVGVPLFIRGKRYMTPRAEDAEREDTRPPIVYLRSFQDEASAAPLCAVLRVAFTREGIAGGISSWGPQEQFAVAELMNRIGPYVALGRPGEPFPEMGAARRYVSNDEWQKTVRDYLKRARLVVVQAGRTEGLRWEIAELVATCDPRKLLVILPGAVADHEAFFQWANLVLPHALPPTMAKARLLTFNRNWKPTMLSPRGELKETLAPWFLQNSITLPP